MRQVIHTCEKAEFKPPAFFFIEYKNGFVLEPAFDFRTLKSFSCESVWFQWARLWCQQKKIEAAFIYNE